MPTLQLGVLVSGSGTNLQAILDAVAEKRLDAQVRLVISNRKSAFSLQRAANAGVPARVISHRAFADRQAFDRALVTALQDAGVQWVVLAGFMRVLGREFLDAFPMRVVNIHPALLPSFPGVDAQAQALEYGVAISGCTVHFVDQGTDTGAIIAQAAVPVHDGDSRDDLCARVLKREHQLVVQVLGWLAEDRVLVVTTPGMRPRVVVKGVQRAVGAVDPP